MKWRSDTAQLIAGKWVSSAYPGHGVLGSVLRATTGTGDHGAAPLYDDWDSGDDSKEFRLLIERWPTSGTLTPAEDSVLSYVGESDYATGRLFVDGADLGTETISFFGGSPAVVSLAGVGDCASSEACGLPTLTPAAPATAQLLGLGGAGSSEAFGLPTIIATGSIAMVTPVGRILKVKQDGSLESGSPAKPVSVGAKLDFAWDWSDWLQDGELISAQSITSHQSLAASFLDRAGGIVSAWVEVDGATAIGTELLASCEITTSLGRIDKRSFRLVAEIR